MSDEDKEQQKLTATWINGMAIGSFTAGVATPLVGWLIGVLPPDKQGDVISYGGLFFAASVLIHIAAYVSLFGYGDP